MKCVLFNIKIKQYTIGALIANRSISYKQIGMKIDNKLYSILNERNSIFVQTHKRSKIQLTHNQGEIKI